MSSRSNLRAIQGAPERLRPPADLAPEEQKVFTDLVSTVDPSHFQLSDMPLLVCYAGAVAQEREASRYLRAEGYVVAGKPSPWIVVQEKCTRAIVALSMRLRLAPQSRDRTKVRKDRVSAYERSVLEGRATYEDESD
jgi:hypothetical protein